MRLKLKDFIRYRSDGMKGRVTAVTDHCVTLHLTDGMDAYLHPTDAAALLDVWVGDPTKGDWQPLANEVTS